MAAVVAQVATAEHKNFDALVVVAAEALAKVMVMAEVAAGVVVTVPALLEAAAPSAADDCGGSETNCNWLRGR